MPGPPRVMQPPVVQTEGCGVKISWRAPGDADITKYGIQIKSKFGGYKDNN